MTRFRSIFFFVGVFAFEVEVCPPWCHCCSLEVEYQKNQNVWVHTGREAAVGSAEEAPETVAEGPRAQPQRARDSGQTSGSRR